MLIFLFSGINDAIAEEIVTKIGLTERMDETKAVVKSLYHAFIENDASLIEINPYAEDTYGKSMYFEVYFLIIII